MFDGTNVTVYTFTDVQNDRVYAEFLKSGTISVFMLLGVVVSHTTERDFCTPCADVLDVDTWDFKPGDRCDLCTGQPISMC